jgi:hypothetical protein
MNNINMKHLEFELQTKFELDFLPSCKNKRIDVYFSKLAIAVEIDECHKDNDASDILKTEIMVVII